MSRLTTLKQLCGNTGSMLYVHFGIYYITTKRNWSVRPCQMVSRIIGDLSCLD